MAGRAQQFEGVAAIPVQIDRPPQNGGRGHIRIAHEDQHQEGHGKRAGTAAADVTSPAYPGHERHHHQAQLEREARHVEHAKTGPAVLERQQRVEQRKGEPKAQAPRHRGGRCVRCTHLRMASNSMISGTSSPTQPLATA